METKDPLIRPTTTSTDTATSWLESKSALLAKWPLLLSFLLGGAGGAALPGSKPVPPPPVSTRQALVPVELAGCQYWFATFGEPTNANFSAALTHSGSCTNWAAHKALSQ